MKELSSTESSVRDAVENAQELTTLLRRGLLQQTWLQSGRSLESSLGLVE